MNIIYKLTNLNKSEGRRFYVGSKVECFIENIDNVDRIVNSKTGMPYYGSSCCFTMKSDMQAGHLFSAEVLEVVLDKKVILERERYWLKELNAVDSPDFYNLANAIIGIQHVDQFAPYNSYGETILGYGKLMSALNNKNGTARKFGFKNLGEFCVYIYTQKMLDYNSSQVAMKIGWERHAPFRYMKDYNMQKCFLEYNPTDIALIQEIRKTLAKGVSTAKVAELFNLEIPTVVLYTGDFDVKNRAFVTAARRGQTAKELEIEITKKILEGSGTHTVSREMGINERTVSRYFFNCVKRNLDPCKLI